MIEMACPSCGRAGQVPKEKLQSRLVCRKCHVVFHMDPGGRAVLGEPNQGKDKAKKGEESEQHSIFQGFHIPSPDELANLGENLSDYKFQPKHGAYVLGT